LKIPQADARVDEVYVSGTRENVDAAVDELTKRVKKHELASFTVTVHVPVSYHARIIGPRGSNIEMYRKKYGVRVNVPQEARGTENNNVDEHITVQGMEDRALECKAEIEQMIVDLESMCREELHIDASIHSRIIGGGGKGIKKIMDTYNVEVRFPRDGDADPSLVTVSGTKEEAVLDAVDHLRNLEEEYMQDHVERHAYEHKAASTKAPKVEQSSFQIKNAPWDMNSASDFPTMGNMESQSGQSANGGGMVWGRPR